MAQKDIIGRKTRVDIPELNINNLEAKIDTGAFHNSIHCKDVEVVNSNGKSQLAFKLLDEEHPLYNNKEIIVDNFRKIRVKNSAGNYQRRYLVKLKVIIQGKKYIELFSLADRSKMLSPVLLGRKFLKGRYIVDVAKQYTFEG